MFDVPLGDSLIQQRATGISVPSVNKSHDMFSSSPHTKDGYFQNSLDKPDYLSQSREGGAYTNRREDIRSSGYHQDKRWYSYNHHILSIS